MNKVQHEEVQPGQADGVGRVSRILYIQYTNPGGYPPLEHSSRMLADSGWQVLFLGTGALGGNGLEFPAHPKIRVRRMPLCSAGWRQKLHYLAYCFWAVWVTLMWHPKWVYASDPLSCLVARVVGWIPGVRMLYHEHDSPEAGNSLPNIVFRARRAVAQRASLCILPNAKRVERFAREAGPAREIACVWNCPATNDAVRVPRSPGVDAFELVYHGSVGPQLIPPTVIHALGLLPEPVKLRVTGYETIGTRGYVKELARLAESLGVGNRVEFRGPVSRWELLRASFTADIGLALMPIVPPNRNFEGMTGASNKAFDYLACGLALLVSDLPDWQQMFVEPGYALACDPDDPQSIAAVIRWLTEHPDEMRAMGERGRQRILKEWNYENVFRPVFNRLVGPTPATNSGARQPVESARTIAPGQR